MDTGAMKERNYRTVEQLRHQNLREQRRLEDALYSKQGVMALHRYQLEEMSREERKIKDELTKIRHTSSTSWGLLPPREGENTNEILAAIHKNSGTNTNAEDHGTGRKKKRNSRQLKRIEGEMKNTESRIKNFNRTLDGESLENTVNEETATKSPLEKDKNRKNRPGAVMPSIEEVETESLYARKMPPKESRLKRPPNPTNRRRQSSIANLDIEAAKDNIAKRLTPNLEKATDAVEMMSRETSVVTQTASQTDAQQNCGNSPTETRNSNNSDADNQANATNEENKKPIKKNLLKKKSDSSDSSRVFDSMRYNPDGSLRKMHDMPDVTASINQAAKARYVRNKTKKWYEKELSVKEVFDKNHKEKSLVLFSHKI